MSEGRDDDWLRRIELYLDVGSDGVVVLVDRARDAHIGRLVRALLRKHPDLSIAVSPEELRSAPKGGVVVYHAEPGDAERLNLVRPVLKDRGLRVVLWAKGELASELPLRAPDLYDWISHRVLCPQQGAPRFASLGLLAAEAADRPVDWAGSIEELRAAVSEAWPGMALHVVSDADYETLSGALSREGDVVAVEKTRVFLQGAPVRWALAEARRHSRVVLLATDYAAAPDSDTKGFWLLSQEQKRLSRIAIEWRVPAAVLELEPHAVASVVHIKDAHVRSWLVEALDLADPAASLARRFDAPGSDAIAIGRAPPPVLRAWGADARAVSNDWRARSVIERDGLIDSPSWASVPPEVRVECTLWRKDHGAWSELAEVAAELGHHDIAVRWDLHAGSEVRALADHLETGLAGASMAEIARLMDLAGARFEGRAPDWYASLRARTLCDAGSLRDARALAEALGDRLDPATGAYLHTFLGEWRKGRAALGARSTFGALSPLRKSAIALAAWACDAAPEVRPHLAPSSVELWDRPLMIWWRWLPALEIAAPEELEPEQSDRLLESWSDPFLFEGAPAERALSCLARAADAARRANHVDGAVFAARGLAEVEEAFSPREHVLEGVLLMMQGRALARLGQPDRATDKLDLADAIVRRTTENEAHPWALIARFEHAWLRAQHRGGLVDEVDAALAQLEHALWPEHRDLRDARKLRARLAPGERASTSL